MPNPMAKGMSRGISTVRMMSRTVSYSPAPISRKEELTPGTMVPNPCTAPQINRMGKVSPSSPPV